MTYYEDDDQGAGHPRPEPIGVSGAVTIAGSVLTRAQAADFGSYRAFTFAGTAGDVKQQLLPYDERRQIARIWVTGTGPVYIGTEAQCAAITGGATGASITAVSLPTGLILPVTHFETLWCISDLAHAAVVNVQLENRRT